MVTYYICPKKSQSLWNADCVHGTKRKPTTKNKLSKFQSTHNHFFFLWYTETAEKNEKNHWRDRVKSFEYYKLYVIYFNLENKTKANT